MGSSMVMMCPLRSLLILSTSAARVVDLPEPVGPVTNTKPRGRSEKSDTTLGRPSSATVTILYGICRIAIATHPRCLNTLPRKRDRFCTPNEKSSSSSVSKRFFLVLSEYGVCNRKGILRRQHVRDLRVVQIPVDSYLRPRPGGHVQVGCALLDHLLKEEAKVELLRRGLGRRRLIHSAFR